MMLQTIRLLILFSLLFCGLLGSVRISFGPDQDSPHFSLVEQIRSFYDSYYDSYYDFALGFPGVPNNLKNVKAAGFFIPPETLIQMSHLNFQRPTLNQFPKALLAVFAGSLPYRNQLSDAQNQTQDLQPQEFLNPTSITVEVQHSIKSLTHFKDELAAGAEQPSQYHASDRSISSHSIPEKKDAGSTASQDKREQKEVKDRKELEKKIQMDAEKNRTKSKAKPTPSEIKKDFYQRSKISAWNNRMPTIGKKKVIGHIRWELSRLPFPYQITKAKLVTKEGRVTELSLDERIKSHGEGFHFQTVDAIAKSDRLVVNIEIDGQAIDLEFEIEELDETF